MRTDNDDHSHVASHTPFKFRCLQQTFHPHAKRTLALVEDEDKNLKFVSYTFESNSSQAKGHLEVVEDLGQN